MERARAASRSLRRSAAAPLVVVTTVAFALTAVMAWPTHEWSVMTDELQTWKIALGITEGDLLPTIHETRIAVRSFLYSVLLAPVVGAFAPEDAFRASHVLNAFLLTIAAVPAYVLTWQLARSRGAALFVACAVAFSPWTVLSTTVLSEAAAYPAFAFAFWLAVRAIDRPSARNDLLALAAIGLAALARTQLVVLVVLFPLTVVVAELYWARRGPERRTAGAALATVVRRHPVLWLVVGVGLAGLLGLQLTGGVGRLLGTYAGTTSGSLVPAGTMRVAGELLTAVSVGAGVVPLLLFVAFVLRVAVRPLAPIEVGFVVLSVSFIAVMLVQVGSFTVRFVDGQYPQDRYVAYALIPLLAGAAAYLAGRRPGRELLPAAVIAFWLLAQSGFGMTPIVWASPAISSQQGLRDGVGWFADTVGLDGVELGEVLRLTVIAAAIGLAALARAWRPQQALAVVGVPVVVLVAAQTAYLWSEQRPLGSRIFNLADSSGPGWIDPLVGDRRVALVPHAGTRSEAWWDAEFFNASVDRAVSIDGGPVYTPFAANALSVDPASGAMTLVDRDPRELLLVATAEHRVGWRGTRTLAAVGTTRLLEVPVPYQTDWWTTGAASDGSIERRADLHVAAGDREATRTVRVRIALAPEAQSSAGVRLEDGERRLRPGTATTFVRNLCVPADQAASARITSSGFVPSSAGAPITARIESIDVGPPRDGPCDTR